MKVVFLSSLSFFFFCCIGFSQPGIRLPSQADIVKFKINGITIQITINGSIYKENYYFDAEGRDTAFYKNGVTQWSKRYEKDKRGRVSKWIQYDSAGFEEWRGLYSYNKDGSFSVSKGYHTTEEYDSKGRLQMEFLMDGGQHLFIYDSIGQLKKIESRPGLDGYDQYSAEYIYSKNGQLREVEIIYPQFQVTELKEFLYDPKGILLRITSSECGYNNQREKWTTYTDVYDYSYTFRQ